MTRIFIDADACPVKKEVFEVSIRNNLDVYVVSNGGIRPNPNPLIKSIFVESGLDKADDYIISNVEKNDIVVSADIPLASECIKKGALIVKHDGHVLNKDNIGNELSKRNLMTEMRSANPFMISNNKSFLKSDRSKFLNSFEMQIRALTSKWQL